MEVKPRKGCFVVLVRSLVAGSLFYILTFPSPGRHIACLSKFWKATRETT